MYTGYIDILDILIHIYYASSVAITQSTVIVYCRTVTIILYTFQTTTNLNNACVTFRLQLFKLYIYDLELL